MLGTKRWQFGNIVGHVKGVKDMSSLADWTVSQFDASLSWDDVKEIRQQWGGKVIVKGILDAEDARAAVNVGVDAIVVSNHGGRQLDGALSSIKALPAIVDAVGDKAEVWMDGGISSGQDVLRAIALGARHIDRACVSLWSRSKWSSWGDAGAGDHPQGAGFNHGALWAI